MKAPLLNPWTAWLIVSVAVTCFLQSQWLQSQESVDKRSLNLTIEADFGKHISPLFKKNCVACHNSKKAEGGLNLETHEAVMKGGESGTSVVPGDVSASVLLKRIIDKEDPMPPIGNAVGAKQLTVAETVLVSTWIKAGALAPVSAESTKLQWQALPHFVHPINALAVSNDGNYVAIGRGNQAYVLRHPTSASLEQAFALVDPQVTEVLRASAVDTLAEPNVVQAAHLDIVQSIAFSPDDSRVAAGGYRSVKIWKRNLLPIDSLSIGGSPIATTLSSISPDGKLLAVSNDGNSPELINLQTSHSQRFLRGHTHPVTALCWLDSSRLISCDSSGAYMLTRIDDDCGTKLLVGQSMPVAKSIAMIAHDRLLAISDGAALYQIKIDPERATVEARIFDGTKGVQTIATSIAGPIALGLDSGVCRLVNRADLATLRDIETSAPIRQLAISPNGMYLATSNGTSAARLWRTEDGSPIAVLDRDYLLERATSIAQRNVHRQQQLLERLETRKADLKKASEAEIAAFSKVQETRDKAASELTAKDNELVAANQVIVAGQAAITEAEAAVVAALKLVETRKAELEAKQKAMSEIQAKKAVAAEELAKRDQALAASKDATDRAAARLSELDATIHAENERLVSIQKHAEEPASKSSAMYQARLLSFASDSSRIAVADDSGQMHLFATSSGVPEAKLNAPKDICSMLATPNGRLISLTRSGILYQWDSNLAWQLERVIGDHERSPFSDRITALDFSPDGKMLAVGSGPPSRFGDIKIVEVESGNIAKDFGEVHSDTVLAIRYSPDGRKLACGGADKQCRILDATSGKQLASLEGHTHHVLSLAWKDDGVTIATGSADLSIKLWNIETGTQSRTIGGAKKEVTALQFVGQGNQFIAANASGIVQLFDAGSGSQVRAFSGAECAVLAIGVSPDGKYLFAGGQDGHHWAWQVEDAKKLK